MVDYRSAGVDREEGYKTVSSIKEHSRRTKTDGVLSSLGSFAALYELKDYIESIGTLMFSLKKCTTFAVSFTLIISKQEEAPSYPEEKGFVIYVPTHSGFKRGDLVRVKLKKTGELPKT